jgi:hypothetical protein
MGLVALFICALGVLLRTSWMLHALCVIALAVLFSGGSVRLCRIFVKFGGFVVIVICHTGSIASAPSAQQHTGLQPVPKSNGMVWWGLAGKFHQNAGIATAVRPLREGR